MAAPALDTGLANLTPAQRSRRGKDARRAVPRESHREFSPAPARDPLRLLETQVANRVPELVPIRWGRMASSEFAFFRGAALTMASDLATTPMSGLTVQACGDAHLLNFGVFGSPERRLTFDINDFDETLPGPWEWDVKRLATSLELAGRGNSFRDADRVRVVLTAVARYRAAMRDFAGMTNLGVWYARVDVDDLRDRMSGQLVPRQRKSVEKGLAKARSRDGHWELSKLTSVVGGRLRIVADPPLLVPLDDLLPIDADREKVAEQLRALLSSYRRTLQTDRRYLLDTYDAVDLARKVVGVGSVGTRCWIVLALGKDAQDPLFLQVKEAETSVLSRFIGASRYANQGQRVVAGQRLMQATSDIFLGWQRTKLGLNDREYDFYVRQLRDWKYAVDVATMTPADMLLYGELCAWTLARAHARSGDRIAIASYLGNTDVFDRAVADFAGTYADVTHHDWSSLVAAIDAGRIGAELGR
jgi:uncharacterized protein (DUF2252 family)